MSQQPALQPHVACLGNPVAGNPTQFVMSRATRDCGLDWRFFTSQVREDEFEIAVKGVQALGLHGMVLLDPFQSPVIPLLDTVTESARLLDRVTVARSDGNSWLGDNLLPIALWHCITSRFPEGESSGYGVVDHTGRHPAAAQAARNQTTEKLPVAPAEPTAEQNLFPRKSVLFYGTSAFGAAMTAAWPNTSWELIHWPTSDSTEKSVESELDAIRARTFSALVIDGEISGAAAKAIQNLNWIHTPLLLRLDSPSQGDMRKQIEVFQSRGFTSIEQVEWLSYEASANFTFWTGVVPPIDLIRESLEEYLQW